MAGWKDLLLETLKLTDEVKRLNKDIEKLDRHLLDVDKRVIRLETMVEIGMARASLPGKH